MCVWLSVFVCVCVFEREGEVCMFARSRVCMCMCMCVCDDLPFFTRVCVWCDAHHSRVCVLYVYVYVVCVRESRCVEVLCYFLRMSNYDYSLDVFFFFLFVI